MAKYQVNIRRINRNNFETPLQSTAECPVFVELTPMDEKKYMRGGKFDVDAWDADKFFFEAHDRASFKAAYQACRGFAAQSKGER